MMEAFQFVPLPLLVLLLGATLLFSRVWEWILNRNWKWALASLSTHVLAGLGLYWLYARVLSDPGNGDVVKYLSDAGYLSRHLPIAGWWKVVSGIGSLTVEESSVLAQINHWELSGSFVFLNEGRTLIRLHMMLWPFTGGFWLIHVCFFALVSWMGAAFLAMASENLLPKGSPAWMPWAIGASPSWLFWSSGMLKEALVSFGMGLFLLALVSDWRKGKKAVFLCMALIILVFSKVYLIPVIGISLMGACLVHVFHWRPLPAAALAIGFWICLLLIPASGFLTEKQHQFVNLANGGIFIERNCNGAVDTIRLDARMKERLIMENGRVHPISSGLYATLWVRLKEKGPPFILNKKAIETWRLLSDLKPAGSRFAIAEWKSDDSFHNLKSMGGWMLNAIARPFPVQCRGPLDWVNLLESWILLAGMLWGMVFYKPSGFNDSAVTVVCLAWCLGLALLVGIATPVVGALVRYRAVMHPAMMLIVLRAWISLQTSKNTVKAP